MNIIARIKTKLRYFSDLETRLDQFAAQIDSSARRYSALRSLYDVLKTRADTQTLTVESLMSRVRRLEERPERSVEIGDLIARVKLLEAEQERQRVVTEALRGLASPNFTFKS